MNDEFFMRKAKKMKDKKEKMNEIKGREFRENIAVNFFSFPFKTIF